jgi:hypothetical protein
LEKHLKRKMPSRHYYACNRTSQRGRNGRNRQDADLLYFLVLSSYQTAGVAFFLSIFPFFFWWGEYKWNIAELR